MHTRMHRHGSKLKKNPLLRIRDQENHLTPIKLESEKQAKKVVAKRDGLGWEVPIQRLGSSHVPLKPRPTKVFLSFLEAELYFK